MTTIDRDPKFAIWLNERIMETKELLNQQDECLHRHIERIYGEGEEEYVKECCKNITVLTGKLMAYLEVWKLCYPYSEWEASYED